MIENIRTNEIGQTFGKAPLPYPDPVNMRTPSDSDAAIEVSFADILNKAHQVETTDANAVDRARELLLSGRLASPENIRMAAENIIMSGI